VQTGLELASRPSLACEPLAYHVSRGVLDIPLVFLFHIPQREGAVPVHRHFLLQEVGYEDKLIERKIIYRIVSVEPLKQGRLQTAATTI
jgi:hypothetical protein